MVFKEELYFTSTQQQRRELQTGFEERENKSIFKPQENENKVFEGMFATQKTARNHIGTKKGIF
jgi:hypothetical protein